MHINVEYIFHDWDTEHDCGYCGAGWYFWDETGAYCHGPYESATEAHISLKEYAKHLQL